MHPYSVAKMVTSLAFLHGRAVDLNMVAGGFKNDLLALGDETEHDDRYERTTEYTQIVTGLLGGETVTVDGRWHNVKNLKLTPPLPAELVPELTISGSSPAGRAAAEKIGALGVRYPKPVEEEERESGPPPPNGVGVRVGVIARESAEEAWRIAHERFPEDRKGELKHQLAMKVSDSHWHRELSGREQGGDEANPYWLGPFQQGQTFCPYLVGDHDTVGAELGRYIEAGFTPSSSTSRPTARRSSTPAPPSSAPALDAEVSALLHAYAAASAARDRAPPRSCSATSGSATAGWSPRAAGSRACCSTPGSGPATGSR